MCENYISPGRDLKLAGYVHYKILTGNIFGLISPGRDLKLAGYVHYKILTGNIFGLILKTKMAATGVSLSVMKSTYISLIIGPRSLRM